MSDKPTQTDWVNMAESFRKEVIEAISALSSLISRYDPIEILSRVATYILVSSPDQHKDADSPRKSESNLEYLISFVAAHPMPESAEFPNPDIIERTIELLTQIHLKASCYYSSSTKGIGKRETPIEELAHSFRTQKLLVRGDGYWPHLRSAMEDLLNPHANKLLELLGFTYADYLAFMERTEREMNDQCWLEMDQMGNEYRRLMKPWKSCVNNGAAESEKFQTFMRENRVMIDAAKADFDRIGTPSIYLFNPQTKAEQAVLKALSTEIGHNTTFTGTKPEHAFWPLTQSDTASRPILVKDETHYSFNISKLQREAFTLIGDLLRTADNTYWEHKFLKARDSYLETETACLFQKAMPGAEVLRQVVYPLQAGGTSETDILVILGGVLMVVECKAGRLDPATWRGGEKRIISDMKATVAAGLNQAERFVGELVRRGSMRVSSLGNGAQEISSAQFSRVFCINVTLELISSATSTLWELEAAGLVNDTSRCWSVSLNDLRTVVEILNDPAVFVHYLIRRLDTKTIKSVEAHDELEYMMRYVKHGLFFREGNAPRENQHILITRYTDELDQYYRRIQGHVIKGPKPRINLGKGTTRILEILKRQKPQGWLVGSIELLEFDVPAREKLCSKLQDHLKMHKANEGPFALSIVANSHNALGIAFATSRNPGAARELVKGRCQQHCRTKNFESLTVFHFGIPISGVACEVFNVGPVSTVDKVHSLLSQLKFETLETRHSITSAP